MSEGTRGTQRLIYDQVLGLTIDSLAPPVRAFHRAPAPAYYAGRSLVERSANPLAHLIASILGFPAASIDCPIEVDVARAADGTETWTRRYAGKPFVSRQFVGRGRWHGLLVERIGAMDFACALVERNGGELHLELRGWTAFGLPMPRALSPRAVAFEHGAGDRFNFDVEVSLPLFGWIVRYRGWLERVAANKND